MTSTSATSRVLREGHLAARSIAKTNRCARIDSKHSFDTSPSNAPLWRMSQDAQRSDRLQILVLERVNRDRRMARYYVLAIEPTLFDEVSLTREWGRLGANPRRRVELHADGREAGIALDKWLHRKQRRGYVARL